MANISQIKLPNNTTYDIKDNVSGYTTNTGTITKIQTTAGAHTTINVSSGAAAFNVPTKTSDLSNDSGFITNADVTDEKVYQSYKAASGYTYWRPLLIGYSSGSAETFTPGDQTNLAYTFSTLKVQPSTGTIRVGNLALYNGSYTATLTPTTLTANRTITIPNKTGTMALTSDIPATTGSSTTGISIAAHGTGTIIGVQSSTTTASKVTVSSHSTDYGVTAAGSGSASLTFTIDGTDSKKLNIAFSHTHTAPTLGSKVPTVSASDVTVPIKNASASTFVTGTTHTITDNGHTHTI